MPNGPGCRWGPLILLAINPRKCPGSLQAGGLSMSSDTTRGVHAPETLGMSFCGDKPCTVGSIWSQPMCVCGGGGVHVHMCACKPHNPFCRDHSPNWEMETGPQVPRGPRGSPQGQPPGWARCIWRTGQEELRKEGFRVTWLFLGVTESALRCFPPGKQRRAHSPRQGYRRSPI